VPESLSFATPAPTSSSGGLNDYIQSNFGHVLCIWWAYYWPTTLITFLLGILLGMVVRVLYQNVILPGTILIPVSKYGGYVINYIVAFFIMQYVLGKKFRHFRLALVSSADLASTQTLPATFERTLRVWWIFTWRTVVYGILALAFVLYPVGMFVGLFRPSPLFSTVFFFLLGTATGGALSLFVIYSNILEEDIGDFRVVLLPRKDRAPAQTPLAANPAPLG
jgi:hypothetical protein